MQPLRTKETQTHKHTQMNRSTAIGEMADLPKNYCNYETKGSGGMCKNNFCAYAFLGISLNDLASHLVWRHIGCVRVEFNKSEPIG